MTLDRSIQCNSINLLNKGWKGKLVDANFEHPLVLNEFISIENINEIAKLAGNKIDFFSIDIDSYDWHVIREVLLKKIIDMLLGAIPSIIDIVILMFIIFYIYAIIGNFLFESVPSGLWKDFLVSMLTLFRILTFEDWTDVMYEGMEIYPWSWIYFVSFVIIAAFVFFNLFIAVIIGEMEKINNKDIEDEIHDDSKKIDLLLKEISQLRQEVGEIKNDSK